MAERLPGILYSNFKLELGDVRRFDHVGQLVEAVHGQLRYYNHDRIRSAHRMPPVAFRLKADQRLTASLIHSLLPSPLLEERV